MKLLYYRIKHALSIKETIISLIALTIAATTGIAAFSFLEKEVEIYVNDELVVVKTLGSTYEEALESASISVDDNDYTSKMLNEELDNSQVNTLYIKKAVPVTVYYGTEKIEVNTVLDYVYELLDELHVVVDENDRVEGVSIEDPLSENLVIRIVKVDEELEVLQEEIPFDVVVTENKYMDEGDIKITEPGEEGIIEHVYKCVYENGECVSKEKMYQTKLKDPVTQYEDHGIIKTYVTSTGYTIRYTEIKDVRMTAYTASLKDCGKLPDHPEFGITFTGRQVERGMVAVDPKYIPLESKLYVEIDGETDDYGFALAADTGSAIRDDLIDLYFHTQSFVDRWGTKWGRVYILADDDEHIETKIPK